MIIYEVEGPDGKIIKVQGPEDATDDELTSAARSYYSQSKTPAAKPAAKAESEAIVPGQMPALSKPEDLAKQNAAKAPDAKKEESTQPEAAGSIFEPLSKGEFGQAWENVPQTTRDLITYGTPPVLGATALAGAGLKYLRSGSGIKPDVQGGDGIRARTIGGNTPPPPPPPPGGGTPPAAPAAPTLNPKEAQLATDIENKYGYKWKDIKSNFGLSDVTITNPLEAGMLAGAYHQQQYTSASNKTPSAPAAEVIAPVAETPKAPTAAPSTPAIAEPVNIEPSDWAKSGPATNQAPVAETPKAAPPPAEAPKTAVPPEKLTKEQKGMKNHLVSMYGGGPEGEAAYAKVKEILGKTPEFPKGQGGGLSAEQTKIIKDWRKVNIEGPKVNLTYDMKKALKGGGGLAVLAAIPGFAEAASNKDFGKMTDIATDFLVLPFAQSREVGEGEQFELAKRRYEGMVGGGRGVTPAQAYNVGAGRGVAPPSAYRR